MRQVVIHDRPEYSVTSHGNGTAYTFTHKPSGRSVFFQGDDAARFREEFNAGDDFDATFARLWGDYEAIAE